MADVTKKRLHDKATMSYIGMGRIEKEQKQGR